MKNAIQFFGCAMVLFSLGMPNIKGQAMIVPGNQWKMCGFSPFNPQPWCYSAKVGSDTLLDGKIYYKLYERNWPQNEEWSFTGEYLREDSLKHVFHKNGPGEEVLLYDFNLNFLDIFEMHQFGSTCTILAYEIDSVTLNNGDVRKRIKFMNFDDPEWGDLFWIEGVGSDWGLTAHFNFCGFDGDESLSCFFSNGEALYPPSCDGLDVGELKEESAIRVYPNPVQTDLTVDMEEPGAFSYAVYDLRGNVVQRGELNDLQAIITLREVQPGSYMVAFRAKNGKGYVRKIIKT